MPPRPSNRSALADIAHMLAGQPSGGWYSLSGDHRRPTAYRVDELIDPEDLMGVIAPSHWHGVGVVLTGRAHDVSDSIAEPSVPTGTDVEAVTLAVVLDREGRRAASTLDHASGHRRWLRGEISGTVADLLHRTLGLSCEAERRGTDALIAAEWLAEILDTVADPNTAHLARNWSDIVALHPLFVDADPSLGVPSPLELAEATFEAAASYDWAMLRTSVGRGRVHIAGLSAGHARWLDDASFARWMLSVHRPAREMLDDLSLFIDGPTLGAVHATHRALDWLGFVPSSGCHPPTGDR